MLSYMAWSYQDFYAFEGASSVDLPPLLAFSTWLDKTSLFTQAWDIVLRPGVATWISEHITNYTITFWVFFVWIYIQPETGVVGWKTLRWGKKEGAAFVLLGQLVAISVAAALFFSGCAARGLGASKRGELRVPLGVWAPLLLSASLSALVPMTIDRESSSRPLLPAPVPDFDSSPCAEPTFLPNLLLFHILLFVPFLPLQGRPSLSLSTRTTCFLLLVPTLPALAHWPPDPLSVADTFWNGNHALRSIGSDAIWSCVGLTAWSVWQKKGWTSITLGIVVFWLLSSALGFGLDL